MTDKILYWASTVFAGVALVLFVSNMCLINGNQKLQADINQKQNVINIAANVAPLNQQLSQALYQASLKNDDGKIRDLLTSQGFTLPKGEKAQAKAEAESKAKKSKKGEE